MNFACKIIFLLTAVLVTCPLIYFSLFPVYLVHIQIHPNQSSRVRIFSTDILVEADGPTVVFFDLRAYVEAPSVSKVLLEIRPFPESTWYPQSHYTVSDGFILGTTQLGSSQWPLKRDERFSFRLSSDAGTVLSEGQIIATVKRLAGAEHWVIGGIGLLASVLEIASTLFERHKVR